MSGEINLGRATVFLMVVIIAAFVAQQFLDFSPLYFSRDFFSKPWILITSTLLHSNIAHLLYNLYSLFIFGSILEANTNSKHVLLVVLLGGVLGNLGFAFFSSSRALGFSGSVYALIGAVTFLLPNVKIPLPLGLIFIPGKAKFVGPIIALGELVLSVVSFDNIAHSAHLFGFVGGALVAWQIKKKGKDASNVNIT